MEKINSELAQQLRSRPNHPFKLIVRTTDEAGPHVPWLKSMGIEVTQQFRLTPGLAVSCTGTQALRLPAQDWVLSVELDAPVTTM